MSITLTTASIVNTVLGGSDTAAYNHAVLSPLVFDATNKKITGTIRLTASASPNMDVVTGRLVIDLGPGSLLIEIDQLDIRRKMQLSPGQIIAVQGFLDDAQNSVESGLISVGVIDGIQTIGT
jgi:hypothetical protein